MGPNNVSDIAAYDGNHGPEMGMILVNNMQTVEDEVYLQGNTNTPHTWWMSTNLNGTPDPNTVYTLTYTANAGIAEANVPLTDFQVFPNPASTTAQVSFGLQHTGTASLTLTDLGGRALQNIQWDALKVGKHTAALNTAGLSPGVYLLRLSAGTYSQVHKLVIGE